MFLGGGSSLLAVALGAGAALAAPVSAPLAVTVEFNAPQGCSSLDAFSRAVEARSSGVRLTKGRDANARLQVRLSRASSGPRVRGEIRIVDEQGQTDTREVEGATCAEVTEVLALTAALALERMVEPHNAAAPNTLPNQGASGAASGAGGDNPDNPPGKSGEEARSTGGAAGQSEQDKKKAGATASAEQGVTAKPTPRPRSASDVHLALSAHALFSRMLPPEPNFGGEIGVRAAWPRGPSFGLGLAYSTNGLLSRDPDLKVRWLSSTASACPLTQEIATFFAVEPCAQLGFGWLWVRHDLVEDPETASRSWWSLGATLRARAGNARGLSFELEGGASYALVRRRFVVEPSVRTWETARFVPVAKLGLVLAF